MGFNFLEVFNGSLALSFLFAYSFILGDDIVTITALYFFILLSVGYGSMIICMKLHLKWGMRKIVLRFGLIKAVIQETFFLLILNPLTQSLIWIGVILSMFFGGYAVFNSGFMFLCMDEDEINQGTRREGIFLGTNALITKPAQSLGSIIATLIFSAFGFVQNATIQSDTAITGIKILFFLVPAIGTLIGLIFMYFYPIHGERLQEIEIKLEALHTEKRNKLVNDI